MNLNKYIDHTNLKPDATMENIEKLCDEAIKYGFKSVCVNPFYVDFCARKLKNTGVLVCTVVGFPLGQNKTEIKCFETKEAIKNGATEIDMVINIGALKDRELEYVYNDIKEVVKAADGKTVKVIIETCLLTDEEKEIACQLAVEANADFVKTSTGFSTGGATIEDVKLMYNIVDGKAKVKASGGIKTIDDVKNMISSGAKRIGTSNAVNIINNKNTDLLY